MKTKCFAPVITLTILIAFATISYAKVNTILQVIPTGATGWVRVNNLADLNEKVDEVMRKVAPPGEEVPQGIILKALSQLLPIPEVNSILELEDLGFNASGNLDT